MSQERLSMRKIEEVLRLKYGAGLSHRAIAQSCSVSPSTVSEYITHARTAGLSWPLPEGLSDEMLEELLFPQRGPASGRNIPQPDWVEVHKELRRKSVTLSLLWVEYRQEHPDGYGYSQFCHHYRTWAKQLKPMMRQKHKAGEKLFVDYAGQTAPVVDPETGEIRQAQIFVATLGASNYTYTEAHWSQDLANWIGAHVRALAFLDGVPEVLVPDNLKAGVKSPNLYEPDLNPTYHELAVHYGAAVIPARVAQPRDKALGENAVQQVKRWVVAPLRKQRFFGIDELNQAMRPHLSWVNDRQLTGQTQSRRELFELIEKDALQPLPDYRFEYLEVKQAKVHLDYHVSFKKHQYSVPHQYTRKTVLLRASERLVEIYHQSKRIACHLRNDSPGYSTEKEHMPANHRWVQEWSPERFTRWARQIGPQTEILILAVLASRRHPEQAFRACLGILKLANTFSPTLLEAACGLALESDATSYKAIKRILDTKKDALEARSLSEPIAHEHIRGQNYYT